MENLQHLKDGRTHIAIGFIQGGIATNEDTRGLLSLGSMYYEPLWVFYRSKTFLDQIAQLQGKKLAVGSEGSGTQELALQILAANDMEKGNKNLVPLAGQDVTLIAVIANLVARNDIHPALISLLAQAAFEAHGKAGMFQQAGEFPAHKDLTFEVSKDTERYCKMTRCLNDDRVAQAGQFTRARQFGMISAQNLCCT